MVSHWGVRRCFVIENLEDGVVESVRPMLRQKLVSEIRRPKAVIWPLVGFLFMGPKSTRAKAMQSSIVNAVGRFVEPMIAKAMPPREEMARMLDDAPSAEVNNELARRLDVSVRSAVRAAAEEITREEIDRLRRWAVLFWVLVSHVIHAWVG